MGIHAKDISKQLKESYGRLLYSYTTHNKESQIIEKQIKLYNWCEIILSAVTTTGLISALFTSENSQNISIITSLILSTILLVIRLINPNDILKKKMESHKNAANSMWIIKEQYLSLLTDLPYLDINCIIEKRDELVKKVDLIYCGVPQTSNKAYAQAQKALKENEEQFFTKEEQNKMLPEHLRDI